MVIFSIRDQAGRVSATAAVFMLIQHVAAKKPVYPIDENANPDVSGRVNFYAPRLDQSYPGSWGTITPNPWTLELNITRNGTDGTNVGQRSPLFTLRPIPPAPGLDGAVYFPNGSYTIGDVDPWRSHPSTQSWYVQMGVPYWTADLEVPESNDKERGTYPESIWTKECISAMRKAIKNQDQYDKFTVADLPSCEGQPEPRFPYFGVNPEGNFTKETIDRNAPQDVYSALTEYDKRGASTFPIVLVFNIPYWLDSPQPPLPDENIVFACVRADTTHNGAKMPAGADLPTGGSAREVVGQVWTAMWFAIVSSAFILLFEMHAV